MSKALKEFIKQENTRLKLEWQIKENTALNKVYKILAGANIDKSLQNFICLNYNFYRFMYSLSLSLRKNYLYEQERSSDPGTLCQRLFKIANSGSGRLDRSTHE